MKIITSLSSSPAERGEEEQRVVIRIEPINTRLLKNKFAKRGPEHSIDVSSARAKKTEQGDMVYEIRVDGQGFNVCDLRLRAKGKQIVERVQRVYFDRVGEFCFYDRKKSDCEGNVIFLLDSLSNDFILPLEPFGSVGREVLVRQAFCCEVLHVSLDCELEQKAMYLEWSSCDVALDQIDVFNSTNSKREPVDEYELSSRVTALQTITDLSKEKVMIAQRGLREIALREHLDRYCLGETLFDSHDDASDFGGYKKRIVLQDRVFFTVMASQHVIEAICFGAPHRVAYPKEQFMFLTDPPKMSILVLRIHIEATRAYLEQKPCVFSIGEATDWVPMSAEEKKERQRWLRDQAEQTAAFYTFFGTNEN